MVSFEPSWDLLLKAGRWDATRSGKTRGLFEPCKPSIDDTLINHSSLTSQTSPHRYVYWKNSSTNAVPSACYRKSKCRQNIDSTTGLRHNGEPHDLPAGKAWEKGAGTWSKFWMWVWSHYRVGQTWPVNGCQWQSYFSSLAPKHDGTSGASISSTMSLCSPTIRVTFFTILVESSQVAQRNSRLWKSSFVASVEKKNYETNCMQYG